MSNRDYDFPPKVIENAKLRAAFICSNPDCRNLTIAPLKNSDKDVVYNGQVAHINSGSYKGGPRYKSNLTIDY